MMAISHPISGNSRPLWKLLVLLLTCLVMSPIEALLLAPPVHADSEASSEAGLEANVYARGRRRWRGGNNAAMMQQMKMQSMQQKQLQARLAKNQAETTQHERRLASMPDRAFIKEYGSGRRQRSGMQNFGHAAASGASGVSNSSPSTPAAGGSASASSGSAGGGIPSAVSGGADELAPYRGNLLPPPKSQH